MLELPIFLGLGAVAVWTHLRFPRARPSSLLRAAAHVVVSFGAFALLPLTLSVLLPLVPGGGPYLVLALLFPTLTYVLLSWLWLIGRILNELFRGPRGGHPAATEH